MSSNNNFKETFLTKKGEDIIIGEDSTDYLTVNSETRFLNDVNIGGSSIKLRSTDDTNANNFIEIMGKKLHSTHAQTLREIRTITEDGDNQNKILKIGSEGAIVAGDAGSGGSGIVNNRIDGDLTIGEDDREMLTIASKLHIPGGESGQVLTKGTNGSIEYGPTSFPSVNLPGMSNSEHLLCRNITTGTINIQQFASNTSTYFDFNTVTDENGNPSNTNGTITLPNGKKTLFQNKSGHTLTYIIDLFCHEESLGSGFDYFELWANVSSDINTIPDINTSSKNRLHFHEDSDEPGRISFNCIISVPNNYYLHILGKAKGGTINIGWGNTSTRHDLYTTIDIVALYNRSNTFTTANPLLANPSTADKGKIVTVNAAGDDLEYGANFRELAFGQTIIRTAKKFSGTTYLEKWLDLSSHNTTITDFNTDVSVSVSQGSRVKINCITGVSDSDNNGFLAFRLGKKVNGNVIWGSSNGILADRNDYQTDPKGDNGYADKDDTTQTSTTYTNRIECWDFIFNDSLAHLSCVEPSFVDTDPTNGLSGTHTVTYFLRVRCENPSGSANYFYINRDADESPDNNRQICATIFTVEEIGSGAITSFTQEQALAGAGGTAAFTNAVSGIDTNYGSKDNLVDNKLYSDSSNSSLYQDQLCSLLKGGNAYWFYSVTFTTPQIITKYRIWGRGDGSTSNQNPRDWEFRAATDSSTYNATDSTTYTVLDSQVSATFNSYTSTANASDNLSLGNVYNLSTIGAYKYYVLHITANGNNAGTGNHSTHCTMAEIALYGGGFTIPSQIGHSGKTLKTNGTALEWSAPLTGLLPPPVAADKGKIVTVNAAGDDLQYGANFRELACKQTLITNELIIDDTDLDQDAWVDLASHTSKDNINTSMNTETTVNVPQNAKVEIKAQIGFGTVGNTGNDAVGFAIRLGKKVNDVIIWGNSNGYVSGGNTDHNQNDPRFAYDANLPNRTRAWGSIIQRNPASEDPPKDIFPINAHYIDEDPTNGVSGYNNVTYFIRAIKLFSGDGWVIGRASGTTTNENYEHNYVGLPTILSAVEIGSGAITSFTQEQALAGAGGTASFTNTYKDGDNDTDLSGSDDPRLAFNNTLNSTIDSGFWHNDPYEVGDLADQLPLEIGVNFSSPQIVTTYRIWARIDRVHQAPKAWQIRAAIDKATYDSGTYTTLDSRTNVTSFPTTSTSTPSDNLDKANEYNLSTIGAYQYYVFYFTESNDVRYMSIGELALYGGGFTIPSQIGHSGKTLKTNGTALEWSAPLTGLLPPPVAENKGKIVTVNAAGDDLQYGPQVLKHNMNFKNIYETGTISVTASTANNNPAVHTAMNITITPQLTTSKVMITVNILGEWSTFPENGLAYLKRTINGVSTDLVPSADGNRNRGLGQFTISRHEQYDNTMEQCNFYYVDEPNTTSEVRYDVMLVHNATSTSFHYNKTITDSNASDDERGASFMSAEEKFANDDNSVGAITSFTQEQALAGAGGTAAFTASGTPTSNETTLASLAASLAGAGGDESFTTYTSSLYDSSNDSTSEAHDDNITANVGGILYLTGNTNIYIAYEFTTPHVVNKYRIWGRGDFTNYNPKNFQLRASESKTEYDNNNFTTLSTITNASFPTSFPSSTASSNLNKSNEYILTNTNEYKYYVLYITENNGTNNSRTNIAEFALYKTSNITALHDNSTLASGSYYSVAFGSSTEVAYEFNTPQIITKYRIWPRVNTPADDRKQNPKAWELRAATDSTTYNNGSGTYTILDSQSLAGADTEAGAKAGWKIDSLVAAHSTGNSLASTATHLANEYTLSTIGAYKYYVLHITDNYGGTHLALSEWALYGGGFTIPSQIGHSGKTLKTNGTALEWSAPLTGLLPPPVAENKGKIVTVNAAGDDLEYGATYTENTTRIHKICNMLASTNTLTTAWPSIVPTDGDLTIKKNETAIFFVNMSGYTTSGGEGTWTFKYSTNNGSTYTAFTDPPNGEFKHYFNSSSDHQHRTGTLKFTTSSDIIINSFQVDCSGYANANDYVGMYALITSGNAITSFTQEQALAGAGGTLFQSVTSSTILGSAYPLIPAVHNNIIKRNLGENQQTLLVFSNPESGWTPPANVAVSNPFIAYEFAVPQIVTSYRIWHAENQNSHYIPKEWELRASADSSTYVASNSNTYTLLDSQTNQSFTLWSTTGQLAASDNLDLSNLYHINTVGAFKYFVLYFKDSNDSNKRLIGVNEWALYGGGFTIPSQVGNTGRLLTTDGTSLGWSTTAALPSVTVPEPTSTNKGRALVSTGDGIEFSDFNSGVSTGFKVYKSGTAFEEVTTNTAVLFDQTTTNVGAGHYDKVTGIYTIPVTGYYNIFANFTLPTVIWSAFANDNPTGDFYLNYDDGSQCDQLTTAPGLININGDFNTTTGIFTCSIPGIYKINVAIYGTVYTRIRVGLFKNNNLLTHIIDFDNGNNNTWGDLSGFIQLKLNINDTLKLKEDVGTSEVQFSGELIEIIGYRIQKSTNSGTSYTELATCYNKPTTSIVESLNQNDLIRVLSGDGSTGSTLNFQQGSTKNSFGVHLLGAGTSTSPIPIYGFLANKDGDQQVSDTNNTDITTWVTNLVGGFAKPSANFNNSTGVYTIPVTGFYQVNGIVKINNLTTGDVRLKININNVSSFDSNDQVGSFITTDNGDKSLVVSTTCKLNINDTIKLTIKSSNDNDYQVSTESTFSVFLLASDTQTNTRQMGLSPIVPLHQLGHDQFAEGKTFEINYNSESNDGQKNLEIASGDAGLSVSSMGTIGEKETTYNLSNTTGTTIDSTTSLMYINRGGTKEFVVPPSPYTSNSNWTNANDYIRIRPLKDDESVENRFYATGSFTIDLSKILTNYIGLWNIEIVTDNNVRLNINSQTFMIYTTGSSTGDNRVISINQKYINVEWTFFEIDGSERLYMDFYMVHPTPGMEIAEPVMPSITLPTPTSSNNGKVLVSNGSGYALQPHSGYVPVYGFNAQKNGSSSPNGVITDWSINANSWNFSLPSSNFNTSSGLFTIPISGYYKVCAMLIVFSNGNSNNFRSNIIINGDTTAPYAGSFVDLINQDYGTINISTIIKLNKDDTIGISGGNNATIKGDTTSGTNTSTFSCFLLNTTEVNATPSINIPLPVAANAGKALTVNSAGTGLEYGNSGAILQVQHARATGRQEITGNTATDITDTDAYITGLSITFTPKKSSSKILITAMINAAANYVTTFGFLKDGSALATPTPTNTFSSGSILTINPERNNNAYMDNIYIEWLDNATNTNNRTYKAAVCDHGNRTIYINNRHNSDFASFSSMTIYEIAQ